MIFEAFFFYKNYYTAEGTVATREATTTETKLCATSPAAGCTGATSPSAARAATSAGACRMHKATLCRAAQISTKSA